MNTSRQWPHDLGQLRSEIFNVDLKLVSSVVTLTGDWNLRIWAARNHLSLNTHCHGVLLVQRVLNLREYLRKTECCSGHLGKDFTDSHSWMIFRSVLINMFITYHCLCASLFLLRMDLTSDTNLRASKTGKRLSKAVSEGSLNQDLIGIALSEAVKLDVRMWPNFLTRRFTWVCSVGSRRIVQDKNAGQICTDCGQVLGVGAEVQGAVLPVVPPVEHPKVAVQLIRHGCPIDLHARCEHYQLEPLGHLSDHVEIQYIKTH